MWDTVGEIMLSSKGKSHKFRTTGVGFWLFIEPGPNPAQVETGSRSNMLEMSFSQTNVT